MIFVIYKSMKLGAVHLAALPVELSVFSTRLSDGNAELPLQHAVISLSSEI